MDVKKVLIFSLAYYPRYVGGAEVSVKEITDRLPEFEFDLVCLRFATPGPAVQQHGNVRVHYIGSNASARLPSWIGATRFRLQKFWFQFAAARYGQKLHNEKKFDALWAVMAHSTGVPAALFKKRNPEVLYILNLQEGDPPEYVERVMRPLWSWFKSAFTSADVVQPLSNFLAAWARRMGYAGPIEIIPNGVDGKKFMGEKVPHEPVVLVTSSRLVKKNAVDTIIRGLSLLPNNVRLVVAGVGPEEKSLRELAKQLVVENRVEFKGFVPHSDLPALLHQSDIFIRPSRSEGQGASFIEAMAAGLPVVATQEGGISDFLFDAKRNPDKPTTGWAVDVDSPEQIAGAVKDILANPDAAKRVTETARTMALEKYDWDLLAKDMRERVFSRVL